MPSAPHAAEQPVTCPSCGAPLATGAVLCVACGFHVKLGRQLATVVERDAARPVDLNPYAPPAEAVPIANYGTGKPFDTDLTAAGERQAKAVVSDAEMLVTALLLSVVCGLVWFCMLPWYGYRLWMWYQLNARYLELQQPNAFSPHGALAGSFQDAKPRLWVGVAVGAVMWALLAIGIGYRIVSGR